MNHRVAPCQDSVKPEISDGREGAARMAWFLGLGITGVVLLALSLVFDGLLDGAFDGALAGGHDGWLSLPVVAGLVAMTGFGGVIAQPATGQVRKPADAQSEPAVNGQIEIAG